MAATTCWPALKPSARINIADDVEFAVRLAGPSVLPPLPAGPLSVESAVDLAPPGAAAQLVVPVAVPRAEAVGTAVHPPLASLCAGQRAPESEFVLQHVAPQPAVELARQRAAGCDAFPTVVDSVVDLPTDSDDETASAAARRAAPLASAVGSTVPTVGTRGRKRAAEPALPTDPRRLRSSAGKLAVPPLPASGLAADRGGNAPAQRWEEPEGLACDGGRCRVLRGFIPRAEAQRLFLYYAGGDELPRDLRVAM